MSAPPFAAPRTPLLDVLDSDSYQADAQEMSALPFALRIPARCSIAILFAPG
jgi:hypothetical protein